jgi:hypothetical protein
MSAKCHFRTDAFFAAFPIPAHRFVALGLIMPNFRGERHYRIVDIGRDAVDRPLRPGEVAWERSGEGGARIPPPVRGPVAAKRCEADDAG